MERTKTGALKLIYLAIAFGDLRGIDRWSVEVEHMSGVICWANSDFPDMFVRCTPFWEDVDGLPVLVSIINDKEDFTLHESLREMDVRDFSLSVYEDFMRELLRDAEGAYSFHKSTSPIPVKVMGPG